MNEIQQIELDTLKAIIELCERHGFSYYALGGTLLGAVRHRGFIPWDDDIDIGIPRPQYDKFIEEARNVFEKKDEFEVVTYRTAGNKWVPRYFCQIHNNKKTMILGMSQESEITTPWVDVFPLDAMPSAAVPRWFRKVALLKKRLDVQLSDFNRIVHLRRVDRPAYERLIIKIAQVTKVGFGRDTIETIEQTERVAKKSLYDDEDWIVNLFGAYKFKEMFPKAWFDEGIKLPFEDIMICCPIEYHKVLTQMYGDYMTPPSEAEKGARHLSSVVEES